MRVTLTPELIAEVTNVYPDGAKRNRWRVILKLVSLGTNGGPIRDYEVWLHDKYSSRNGIEEDDDAARFALALLERRFNEVGRDVNKMPETGAITDGSQIHHGKRENFPLGLASWSD